MEELFPEVITVVKAGLLRSAKTLLMIAGILIPISCLVSILDAYSVLDILSSVFNPLLKGIGLPGESALVLTLGYFVNYYASLGAIAALSLPARDITVLGVMISIAHDLFTESAVCKLIGWSFVKSFLLRLAVSLASGFILYHLYILLRC
ncbi:MAG TPA: nucleoside recognition protein [Firmicutes bacterium]|nr:nucleoside recognition protein [Bacillota bacterium]